VRFKSDFSLVKTGSLTGWELTPVGRKGASDESNQVFAAPLTHFLVEPSDGELLEVR
jgi:hypothetical protein